MATRKTALLPHLPLRRRHPQTYKLANVDLHHPEQATSSSAEPAPSVQQLVIVVGLPPPPTTSANLTATPDTVSHTSPTLPERLWNKVYDELERDKPKPSSISEAAAGDSERSRWPGKKGKEVQAEAELTAFSNADSQMQSEHHEDRSRTLVAGHNPSKDGGSDTALSLWDRAYVALRTNDRPLVKKYQKLLSKKLEKTSSNPNTLKGDLPDQAEESLDETDNRIDNYIDNANLQECRAQLDTLIKDGLQRMGEKMTKHHIAGREFVLQDQIAQAAGVVRGVKDFVSEVIKASPEASLAWASVCVILPLLTSPSIAEQANKDGFTYVIARMRFYATLEPLLWPKNQEPTAADLENLKKEF